MAIFHCQMSVVSRATGRSAVASAAYRCAERLENARDGQVHDYTRKEGVTHAEIVLPDGVAAAWAKDRSVLWNAAEAAEKRSDARVAREFVVALPHELSAEGRMELTRSFAQDLANRTGAAVDFAIHDPHRDGDVRNHHAHLLMTTRAVTPEGLGAKTVMELANKDLLPRGLLSTQAQLVDIRRAWEGLANAQLAREGIDAQIDHRSHAERGLEITPTQHMGVAATNVQRRGGDVERARLDPAAAERNAELILEKPEQVLTLITAEKSVFDQRDIARTLHRYVNDDAQAYRNALAAVIQSPALVTLQAERTDPITGEVTPARYSTREMVELERGMAEVAERLHAAREHGTARHHVDHAMARQDAAIQASTGDGSAGLSEEQRRAIAHVTGAEGIAAVVGFAGAGKSTMLAAAREAWERQGITVHGAALSGKAAEGLEESSGIASRTLASWTYGWDNGHGQLGRGDVLVIDEAGMVGSRQLARFVSEAEQAGAKLVLVGDHEQLQAIGAGAPFRAVAERIGHAELSDIRRQRMDWQREASVAFATHRTAEGLAAYREHGAIQVEAGRDEARAAIVRDTLADRAARPDGTRVAMAHRRADVRALNADIRSALQERGDLPKGEEAGERTYQTNDGERSFTPGDRIVFLQNNRELGVKNGMLGTVTRTEEGRLEARLDGVGRDGEERRVSVPTDSYQALDHGYATTVHKTQGATVDQAFVLASGTMDRHLTYVAMTRHRDGAKLYVDGTEFAGRDAGRLVSHGAAPYAHDPANRPSYFVTLETAAGEQRSMWGADLERAMAEAKPALGAMIGLERTGEPVRLPDGTATTRQGWRVRDVTEMAYAGLAARLSRSGAKETVLDYPRENAAAGQVVDAAQAFAERRGIAAAFGIASEIAVAAVQERHASGARPLEREPDQISTAAPETMQPRRRSMFDGLKLPVGPAIERAMGPEGPESDVGRRALAAEVTPSPLAAKVTQSVASDGVQPGDALPSVARPFGSRESPGILLPGFDGRGRDSLGRGLDAHSIAVVVRADRQVREEREQQAFFIDKAFRDPAAATVRFEALVAREGARSAAQRLTAEPGLLGELRGRDGVFAGKAAKTERDTALRFAVAIGGSVTRQDEAETRAAERYRREVTARMAADGTVIPALSEHAMAALGRVSAAQTDKDRRAATQALLADGGIKAEVEGFRKAVETRFSADEVRSLARMVQAGKPIVHASVRPEQQQAFEAVARSYVTLRDGQREVEHAAQRERMAVRQRQGLGLGM